MVVPWRRTGLRKQAKALTRLRFCPWLPAKDHLLLVLRLPRLLPLLYAAPIPAPAAPPIAAPRPLPAIAPIAAPPAAPVPMRLAALPRLRRRLRCLAEVDFDFDLLELVCAAIGGAISSSSNPDDNIAVIRRFFMIATSLIVRLPSCNWN
jgi:hypothetical protein